MPSALPSPASLKLFLASPSDVHLEREAVSSLVKEINDVLVFLAPEQKLRLELIRYETHAYPDIGQPQEVINRQIPMDYDIFIGVMWKRCGTPTNTAESGTVEEFRRALAKRMKTGRPTIMFYFCDEPVPFPKGEEARQLMEVVKFREELESKGYTLSYPERSQFREFVRGGILRAIRDLTHESLSSDQPAVVSTVVGDDDRVELEKLANEYDEVRREMKAGPSRTRRMKQIAAKMLSKAGATRPLLREYQEHTSPGRRLAAISILQHFPDVAELDWLVQRLDPDQEKAFIGYSAAVALAQAVRSLPPDYCSQLKAAVTAALVLAERLPDDPPRINVLKTVLEELAAKCAESSVGFHGTEIT